MPKYSVQVPITGYVIVEVEADSEDAAIDVALYRGAELADIDEWTTHRQVVYGNVCAALCNKANAELIDER
jgi:hypothetical protein